VNVEVVRLKTEYSDLSLMELRELAKKAGIKSITKYRKGELAQMLAAKDGGESALEEASAMREAPDIQQANAAQDVNQSAGGRQRRLFRNRRRRKDGCCRTACLRQ
jgi:hypothetical protein